MLGVRNLVIALALHLVCFLGFSVYSLINFHREEKIIPIDLSVVVVENLDGNEDEPPPLEKPEPEPPPPPPPPPKPKEQPKPKEPEKPKELEKIVTNVVTKVEKKKEEKKPPEPPKKTAKELREERLKKIRESAKVVNKTVKVKQKQPNGKTDKKTLTDAEIRKLLNQGYKPGKTTNLATSEEQRCLSLIKAAFEAKWDEPPWTDTLKPMVITCQFGPGGRLTGYKLTQSSGDRSADQTILSAAKRVGSVPGLSAEFIEKYRSGIPVRFTVKPQ